ncbi:hypothetical protein BB560_005432 [Smittium megazygosporum]|uniref:tRNA-intron lyase n=1 Tax=Smittium megazygosporum TaxID=133381 RepID=A0A2T9Z5I7_9FUNG|nr:hypothetical protein BB560_005432 [Smittium megazygosporum]
MKKVLVSLSDNIGLVFDPKDVRFLREKFRIVGSMIGSLDNQPIQNSLLGIPLSLLPEEIALLLEKVPDVDTVSNIHQGIIAQDTINYEWPKTEFDKIKKLVFSDLWNKGHYITSGLKFGGDYLVYNGDPFLYHSNFIATVLNYEELLSGHDLVALGRIGTNVKKNRVLCSFDFESNSCIYITIRWSGF